MTAAPEPIGREDDLTFHLHSRVDALELGVRQFLQAWNDAMSAWAPEAEFPEEVDKALDILDHILDHPQRQVDAASFGTLLRLHSETKRLANREYARVKEIEREIEARMRAEEQWTVRTDHGRAEIAKRQEQVDKDEDAFCDWLRANHPTLVKERPISKAEDALKANGAEVKDGCLVTKDGEIVDGLKYMETEVFRVMPPSQRDRWKKREGE